MKKLTILKVSLGISAMIFMLLLAYSMIGVYYKDTFTYGTWINGIYCTGLTVEEANDALLQDRTYDGLVVYDLEGDPYTIHAQDIEYQLEYKKSIQDILNKQKPFEWIYDFFVPNKLVIEPYGIYNEALLEEVLADFPPLMSRSLYEDTQKKQPTVCIMKTDDFGYILVDETRDLLEYNKAYEIIKDKIMKGQKECDLVLEDCYVNLPVTPEAHDTYLLWNRIKAFQDFRMEYHIGDCEEVVDAAIVADWIKVDEEGKIIVDDQGNLVLNEMMIREYIAFLSTEYDTLGKPHTFKATRGDIVNIEGGT